MYSCRLIAPDSLIYGEALQPIMLTESAPRTIGALLLVGLLLEVLLFMLSSWPKEHDGMLMKPAAIQHRYMTVEYTTRRRLGNLMFDYASLLGIAHTHNMTPVMSHSFPAYSVFDLQCLTTNNIAAYVSMAVTVKENWGAGVYRNITSRFPRPPYDVILNGFFQSWKYFDDIGAEVRKHFTFKKHIQEARDSIISQIRKKYHTEVVLVGVHIRRGDVLTARDIIAKGYTTPGFEYYQRAMTLFRDKYSTVQFILTTDSLQWTREHFSGMADVVITSRNSASVDLAILAACDHVIVSVGTYGWWAAWLSNGTTIYYSKWPKPGSFLAHQVSLKDYFPTHWIPLD